MTPEPRIERIGDAILYQGDCYTILPALPEADAVITDPPYDTKTHDGALLEQEIDFQPLSSVAALVDALLRQSRGWCLCFCSLEMLFEYKAAAGDAWIRAGVWDRVANMPQMSGDRPAQGAEGIAMFHRPGRKTWNGGGKAAIYRHMVDRGGKQHPTQKPDPLLHELVGLFTQAGQVVLDPFMGSGTTGVACANLGRQFVGIEREPKYFGIACERISAAYAQGRLFA